MQKKIDWFLLFLIMLALPLLSFSGAHRKFLFENKRVLNTKKVESNIKIDGELNEDIWSETESQSDFIQYEPINGSLPSENTVVKVVYSNTAIYVGAILYDSEPEKIFKEFGQRDNSDRLKADVFSVLISPYNDGINYQEFLVSASGVQTDIRHTGNTKDRSWDAVWESRVSITPEGWVVELRIPFSALRFSSNTEGNWGINFRRLIKRYNEWNSWNPIDNSVSGIVNQSGELSGISGINSPLRLSFSPYISAYSNFNNEANTFKNRLNGGLDFKLGLTESFTLDMTLIPDFGQVKSDDKVLNLSPFEVMYSEQRPFFTEAMDLFSKGNIFYSRRVGAKPKFHSNVAAEIGTNEVVENNPAETRMVNATKISGRMGNGLGIGFFNAITETAYATLKDTISGAKRNIETQGLTNYNIMVFDQTLRNNSYISVINTNLIIPDTSYMANVTATDFVLRNRRNTYAVSGVASLSYIANGLNTSGYKYVLSVDKTSGKFLFSAWHNTESLNYNPNDMGYLQKPNEFTNGVDLGYKIYKPFWKLLNWSSWIGYSNSYLFSPRVYNYSNLYLSAITTFAKNYFTIGINASAYPQEVHDYNEPRVNGRMVILPRRLSTSFWTSTDYRKTLAFDTKTGYWAAERLNQKGYWISISPRVRFSDKLFVVYEIRKDQEYNNLGYSGRSGSIVFMGLRDISTLTNTLNGLFAFSAKSSLNLRVRHYWRWVKYNNYFELNSDGTISSPLGINLNRDLTYGLFNIDLSYQWNFAPGSLLSVVWKNAIVNESNMVSTSFNNSFSDLLSSPHYNSISLKLLYYIDYQTIRKKG
jgi:hypothetical protein